MKPLFVLSFVTFAATLSHGQDTDPVAITDSQIGTAEKTGVTVVKGTIELPREGAWSISGPFENHQGLTEIYAVEDYDSDEVNFDGERMAKLQDRKVRRPKARRNCGASTTPVAAMPQQTRVSVQPVLKISTKSIRGSPRAS